MVVPGPLSLLPHQAMSIAPAAVASTCCLLLLALLCTHRMHFSPELRAGPALQSPECRQGVCPAAFHIPPDKLGMSVEKPENRKVALVPTLIGDTQCAEAGTYQLLHAVVCYIWMLTHSGP